MADNIALVTSARDVHFSTMQFNIKQFLG